MTYGDEVLFDITIEPAKRLAKTVYGIIMGRLGEEFGLALFHTLDDLEQFYELSIEHLDTLPDAPDDDESSLDLAQLQSQAEATPQLSCKPELCRYPTSATCRRP